MREFTIGNNLAADKLSGMLLSAIYRLQRLPALSRRRTRGRSFQGRTFRRTAAKSVVFVSNAQRTPSKSRMSTRCLPAETPVAQGLAGFLPLCAVHPEGYPLSNVKRPRNACCAGALRLFPVPDAGDMVSPKRRIFRFFQLAAQSGRGFPFARAAPKPPETALRQRKNGTGERKFQKGE